MKYDFKEYEMQDLMCKGPMRRRYDNLEERYKGYLIYSYIRGEYQRFSVEDEKEKVFVETDNIEEAKQFIDDELTKTK